MWAMWVYSRSNNHRKDSTAWQWYLVVQVSVRHAPSSIWIIVSHLQDKKSGQAIAWPAWPGAPPQCNRIQLIGSPKTLMVHRNRLKLCYGEPNTRRHPAPTSQRREKEPTNSNQTSPPGTPRKQPHFNQNAPPVPPVPKPTYADVVATRPAAPGGYTTSSDEPPMEARRSQSAHQPSNNEYSVETSRPQRNCQPPVRYGNYITHWLLKLSIFVRTQKLKGEWCNVCTAFLSCLLSCMCA